MLEALLPATLGPTVRVHDPVAQGGDDRDARAAVPVREQRRVVATVEAQVPRRHDRLDPRDPVVVGARLGAATVVGHGDGPVGVQHDADAGRRPLDGFVDRIGKHLEDEVQRASGRERPCITTDLAEVAEVDRFAPVVCRSHPSTLPDDAFLTRSGSGLGALQPRPLTCATADEVHGDED